MRAFSADKLRIILADILLADIPDGVVVSSINTDTRSIGNGQTFVALSGERFDGHRFVGNAVSAGAANVIVERDGVDDGELSVPQIIVKDTRLALAKMAAVIRNEFTGRVIGLTGSVGKTTSKQMLTAIFSQVGKTHATRGNFNNDLGVPFTWFDLPDDAQYAIIEMGANHQGEIAYLAGITRPDVAMITNAGESHLEGFGGLQGVAKGKGELFVSLTAGNKAIVNLDSRFSDYWQSLLPDSVDGLTFSLTNCKATVYAKEINTDASTFTLCHADHQMTVNLPTVGQHNVMNALGSAACAIALDIDLDVIAEGLARFKTAKGRLQKYVLGNLTLIDDTYNANPVSMRASADILSTGKGCRIMVVGDMEELGKDEISLHENLGRDLLGQADCFLCLGEKMKAFSSVNPDARQMENIEQLNDTLAAMIEDNCHEDITVLVKGSRSMRMERVVHYLLETY